MRLSDDVPAAEIAFGDRNGGVLGPNYDHGRIVGACRPVQNTCTEKEKRLNTSYSAMAGVLGRLVTVGAMAAILSACGLMRSPHESGVRYMDSGDYSKAYDAFSTAVEDARGGGDTELLAIALANRSFANDALDRHEEAIRDATESLELVPDDQMVVNNRGVAYLSLRRFDEALTDFERALELDSEYAEAYANRGRLHVGREDYVSALQDLDYAIELDDTLALAFANRAVVHENLGDLDASLADYERSLTLDRDPEVLFTRGMLLFRFSRYEDALADFKDVAELQPDSYLGYRASSQVDFLEQFIKNIPPELMPPTPEPTEADLDEADGESNSAGDQDDADSEGDSEGSDSAADEP